VHHVARHGFSGWRAGLSGAATRGLGALGEAKLIDVAIDAVLAAMDSGISASTARAALRRLDAQLLAPMRAQLSGIALLIVAFDGKLNLVPFEALTDPQGRYALESYLVSYVSSGRDLLRLALPQRPRSSAVLIAGPDYGPRSPAPDQLTFTQLAAAATADDWRPLDATAFLPPRPTP
jgi:CHAT domain-containing protein